MALSSRNVIKYEFLTGKYFLPEKKLPTKKRFEYSPLGKELKVQTGIAKKQYQGLDKIYQFNKTTNERLTLKKYNKTDLIYNSKYSFYKYYRDSKKN